jgi:hypothetical protein
MMTENNWLGSYTTNGEKANPDDQGSSGNSRVKCKLADGRSHSN